MFGSRNMFDIVLPHENGPNRIQVNEEEGEGDALASPILCLSCLSVLHLIHCSLLSEARGVGGIVSLESLHGMVIEPRTDLFGGLACVGWVGWM